MSAALESAPAVARIPWWSRPLARGVVAVLITVASTAIADARLTPTDRHTLWAEDGRDFVSDALAHGLWGSIAIPLGGYLQVLPRFLAWFATAIAGPEHLAQTVTLLSCLCVGVVSALLWVYSHDRLASPVLRVLLALVPPLIPTAPREALGTMNNLHWFLLLLAPWVFAFVPRTWWTSAATAALALVTMLSETQAALFIPLLLLGIRTPRKWPVVVAVVVGTVAEILTTLTSPRELIDYGPAHIDAADVAIGFLTVPFPATWTGDLPDVARIYSKVGIAVFAITAAVSIAVVVAAAVVGTRRRLWMIVATVAGAIAVWSAAILISPAPGFDFVPATAEHIASFGVWRYTMIVSGFLLAALVVAADAFLARPRVAMRLLGISVAAAVVVPLVVNVAPLPSSRDLGPALGTEIPAATEQCAIDPTADVQVGQAPARWSTTLPCSYVTR
ncbi:hypothetical protein [Curtobacterium sp. RRHDQ10]|uniref:hypothetical protein n=1 Tax=Curtobacterium phyllosphaerae TaxID=3413379 RepID=UPI003BEFF0B2